MEHSISSVRLFLSVPQWMSKGWRGNALVLFIAVVCYLNSLPGEFVHDDIFAIRENMDVRPETPIGQLFSNDFWGTPMSSPTSHKSYRPLCVLTFRLNYWLSGLSSTAYHFTNLLAHAGVCLAFLHVASTVIFGNRQLAFLAAVLFAVHPVHTEAVGS